MKTLNADENERKTYKANVSRICPKNVTRMKTFHMRMKIKEQLRWIGHLNVNTSIIYRWIEIVLETKNIGSPSLFQLVRTTTTKITLPRQITSPNKLKEITL